VLTIEYRILSQVAQLTKIPIGEAQVTPLGDQEIDQPANVAVFAVTANAADWNEDDVSEMGTASDESVSNYGATEGGVPVGRCTVCQDRFSLDELAVAPCNHQYCQGCIRELFTCSFRDEESFPPGCCGQPITPESVLASLTPEIQAEFQGKSVEFSTQNRSYCSNTECAAFLTPAMIVGDVGRCGICQVRTCTLCKGESHDGECPPDGAMVLLQELAAQEGWQQCSGCRRMIELTQGCYHMS
jgi:hypothetical protein